MLELTPVQKRELRAQAHHLNPVVSISQKGLQPSVLKEIDQCLTAHGLIKARLYGIERDMRDELIAEICSGLHCANVQHIGNLLVLWRPKPEATTDDGKSALAGRRSGKPVTKKQAAVATEKRGKAKPATPRRRPRPSP